MWGGVDDVTAGKSRPAPAWIGLGSRDFFWVRIISHPATQLLRFGFAEDLKRRIEVARCPLMSCKIDFCTCNCNGAQHV